MLDVGYTTAEEFLEELNKLVESSTVPPDYSSPWVFRGHGDAAWALLPTAWRPSSLTLLRDAIRPRIDQAFDKKYPTALTDDRAGREDYCHYFAGILAEIEAVRQFCETADELGLSVPDGDRLLAVDAAIRNVFQNEPGPLDAHFPELSRRELFPDGPFIYAQHHGIPTRYLDWTRQPFAAAFFAAEFASKAQRSADLTK